MQQNIVYIIYMEQKNYTIKRIDEQYQDAVLEHFIKLDKESIYNRFCIAMNDYSLENYVKQIDYKNAYFAVFDDDLNIVGLGECVREKSPSNSAEVAFSVLKEYQGQGLGNKILGRIVRYAQANNIDTLNMFCLRTNQKVVHLAKKFGLKVSISEGENIAVLDNMKKNDFSPINELVEETIASFEMVNKKNLVLMKSQQKILQTGFDNLLKITFKNQDMKKEAIENNSLKM